MYLIPIFTNISYKFLGGHFKFLIQGKKKFDNVMTTPDNFAKDQYIDQVLAQAKPFGR